MTKDKSLSFWMFLLGAFAAWAGGAEILRQWNYLVPGARVCDALFLASGVGLLAAGGWRSFGRMNRRAADWLGAASAGVFTVTLFAGMLTGAVPCSGAG